MPAKSKSQFKLMAAAAHNPEFAKKVEIQPSVAKEFISENKDSKSYKNLPKVKRFKRLLGE